MLAFHKKPLFAAFLFILSLSLLPGAKAQSGGSSTSLAGTVVDPTGAVVANATVEIRNPVSGFNRTANTDSGGKFIIPNIPFNPYHIAVTGPGFARYAQDVDIRSVVPVNLNITLQVKGSAETVTVEGGGEDLLENTSTFHTDVDRDLFDKMPLESRSSSAEPQCCTICAVTPSSTRVRWLSCVSRCCARWGRHRRSGARSSRWLAGCGERDGPASPDASEGAGRSL